MSAVLKPAYVAISPVAISPFRPIDDRNYEGDWSAYVLRTARYRSAAITPPTKTEMTAYQRQCALAYLGKRAQFHGGACNYTTPRIFSAPVIAALEAGNREQRHMLHPWMKTMAMVLAQIEQDQQKTLCLATVISLPKH
jgi:hypothetical protein